MKTFIKETLRSAEKRMWKEDGGLARHTMECQSGVTGETQRARERERIEAKKSSRRNWVTTAEKKHHISPTYTVFWQAQEILYTTHFCLSPRGSWHVGLISFTFFPGLKTTRLAVLLNCSDNPFKYGIVTTPRLCGMRVLNTSDHVGTWKPILKSFFDREKDCKRRWIIPESKSTWQASDCNIRAFWDHLHLL